MKTKLKLSELLERKCRWFPLNEKQMAKKIMIVSASRGILSAMAKDLYFPFISKSYLANGFNSAVWDKDFVL